MSLVAKPMLVGGAVLRSIGHAVEGAPVMTGRLLLILIYLSGVSGALGFCLWTKVKPNLRFESSGMNNLLIEIALMDCTVLK